MSDTINILKATLFNFFIHGVRSEDSDGKMFAQILHLVIKYCRAVQKVDYF